MEIVTSIIFIIVVFISYKLGKANGYMIGRNDGYYRGYINSKILDGNWPAEHQYYKKLYSISSESENFEEANLTFGHSVPENSNNELKKHYDYVDKHCNSFIYRNFRKYLKWHVLHD